ncbi:MAG: aldehyde dehydrogenase family protein, partial [Actinomycetota bacterium]|nr:aldehyde dehydrogenase family protein [Actinomycetota bacterium]
MPIQGGDVQQLAMLIGGEWWSARSGQTVESLNPATGEVWATIPRAGQEDVDRAVTAARAAFGGGPWEQAAERGRLMRRLADIVRANAANLAAIESIDNGKLLRETLVQVSAVADWLDFFAGLSDKTNGSTVDTGKPNFFAYTRKEPIGVVAAITPWNSPLFLLVWKLAPALAAGCT